jgi:4-amino-4-deoxy-L-arabinose transferase-like glycosyltransferase
MRVPGSWFLVSSGLLATARAPAAQLAGWRQITLSARLEMALVSGVMLAALALRLPHLALVPHFTDEAWEVLWSLPIFRGESFPLTNFNTFKGALFNYLVAGSFALLGPSALAARLLVLLIGVLTVLATYGLGRASGGAMAGLLAAALLAANPANILFNSHIAWSNCITPLFSTIAIWTMYIAVGGPACLPRPRLLVLSGLFWGLAFQTHPAVAALMPGAAVYLLAKQPALLRKPWPYLAGVAFLVGCANLLVFNLENGPQSLLDAYKVQQNYTTDQDAAASYPEALGAELFLLARTLGGAVDTRAGAWSYLIDVPVLLGVALALAGLAREARRGNWLPVLLTLSFLTLLPIVNPKFQAMIHSRYLMPLVPVLLASSAAFLVDMLRPSIRVPSPESRVPSGGASSLVSVLSRTPVRRLIPPVATLILLVGPLLALGRYYDRAYAARETNERTYALAHLVGQFRQPSEPVVLDEAFGSEIGWGVSELRGLRYLLAFQDAPVRVIKITPARLEDELDGGPSVLVVLDGRQLREFGRLPLQPLTAVPERGSEAGLFRLAERGPPRKSTG